MEERAARGAATRKTPKPVATPLPPRKCSHTGNMCPSTAETAARACASRDRHVGEQIGSQQRAKPDRRGALHDVKQKGGCAEAFAAGAKHVGGADVAAANGSNVFVAKQPDQKVSNRNGTEQVSQCND